MAEARVTREGAVNLAIAALLLAAPLAALALDEPYYASLATRIALLAMAGVGLNLALGYGGMVSFGHAAFFGLGGYAAGIAAHHAFNGDLFLGLLPGTGQMLVIWPVAMLVAALAGLLMGAFSLRTKGIQFIMITLAFAQMLFYFAISWPAYGGEEGLPIYVRNTLPGLNTFDPLTFFLVCYGALMLAILAVWRITGSRFGAALQAARMNEVRLATTGIAPYPVKLAAFVISAMIVGLAGALFADLNGFVDTSMLSWHRSGEIMVIVILGGVGRLFGPVVGAAIIVLLEFFIPIAGDALGGAEWLRSWQLWLGVILLAFVLWGKGGVIGLLAGRARHD